MWGIFSAGAHLRGDDDVGREGGPSSAGGAGAVQRRDPSRRIAAPRDGDRVCG